MINFEYLGNLSIVVILVMLGLVVYIAYKVIVKKQRPKN